MSEVLSSMKGLAEEHRQLLVRVTLLFAALGALTIALEYVGPAGVALNLGLTVFLGVSYGAMIAAMICLPRRGAAVEQHWAEAQAGRPSGGETTADLWSDIKSSLSSLVWVTLVAGAAVVAGLVLFVIPGLILMTIWAVAIPVMIVDKLGVFATLDRSRELVKGNGWRVFGFLICLGLIGGVIVMLVLLVTVPLGDNIPGRMISSFLVSCFVNPITAVGPAALYLALTRPAATERPETVEPFAPH